MGTLWNKSGLLERDDNDFRTNAKGYFFAGGTTTALQVYQDAAESIPHTQPITASDGRWPAVFIPFTTAYDVRVLDQSGTELYYHRNIPNPDPVDVSVTIAPEEKVQTGMVHWEPVQGTKSGYVRCNGRSIGGAASSATERANADTSALFTYLWNNLADAEAAVSGGRGASAAADFAANKTIALPNMRGSMPIGLDDMGNTAIGAFGTGISFAHGNATTPGSLCGGNTHTLVTAQLPATTPAGSIVVSSSGTNSYTPGGAISMAGVIAGTGPNIVAGVTESPHFHTNSGFVGTTTTNVTLTAGPTSIPSTAVANPNTSSVSTGLTVAVSPTGIASGLTWSQSTTTFTGTAVTMSFSGTSFGSGTPHNNLPFVYLGTWYMKL